MYLKISFLPVLFHFSYLLDTRLFLEPHMSDLHPFHFTAHFYSSNTYSTYPSALLYLAVLHQHLYPARLHRLSAPTVPLALALCVRRERDKGEEEEKGARMRGDRGGGGRGRA